MPVLTDSYQKILADARQKRATLIAVSKTKPVSDIQALYESGHRDFGENYVQELTEKQPLLPDDIRWHFIGHLQSNKVKYIAPFVYMIHGVESLKLLREINKQGAKCSRKIKCLLQVFVAREETKFGLDELELNELLKQVNETDEMEFVQICGLMAMASFTDNKDQVRSEFKTVKRMFDDVKEKFFYHDDDFSQISMGMSSDYIIALEEGSTMIRVGSLIFGER
ncbi:MAG TPA: YggS family pyridoxal phosphate-dependent enzyme [Chitinophagaceae bacterium]|nr:YggS family pyridoxal phosphate-dependent enzyme [Chitinophagaceae bacterium]